jgi:predicted RNA binding protein YcfA (HicA-like mRNA interferase family)
MGKQHKGKDYIDAALKDGLEVEYHAGSHAKVKGPDGRSVTVPMHNKELPTGTNCHLRKLFFKVLGIALCTPFVIGIINALTP